MENNLGQLDITPVIDGHFFPKPIDELRKEAPPKAVMTGVTEFESLLFGNVLCKIKFILSFSCLLFYLLLFQQRLNLLADH